MVEFASGSKYLNFNAARDYVRNLNIKSKNEWKKFIHNELDDCKPANIPFNPELYYLNKGWIDWNNWLRHETNFLSFEKARDYARSLNFETEKHWKLFIENKLVTRKPENIPSNPELYYFNKGWKNWNDWLIDNKTIGDN